MSSARLYANAERAVVAPAFAAPGGGGSLNVIVLGILDARQGVYDGPPDGRCPQGGHGS